MKLIYLVEDERALSDLLKIYLEEAGYKVHQIFDGLIAKKSIPDKPDLWVLDIMLPNLDGYAIIKEIKKQTPDIKVIFMSARSEDLDRVLGLEMGSDDYIPKPFLPRELVLRVERLLSVKSVVNYGSIKLGEGIFDRNSREIITNNERYALSTKEFDLLIYLLDNESIAKSRSDILDDVWGRDYFGSERVIDDTLRRLRKKIPSLPVETVYGYGYIIKLDK